MSYGLVSLDATHNLCKFIECCSSRVELRSLSCQVYINTVQVVPIPNVVAKISRHEDWTTRHAEIMGPSNAYFYFGPSNSPGQVAYGVAQPRIPMAYYLRRKGSSSK